MQLNIFAQAVPSLKEKAFNVDIVSFMNFISKYRKGEWIYPAVIQRNLKIDVRTTYEIMEVLHTEGYVEQYLEIYCPNCAKYTGQYFKTISKITEEVYCPHCDFEITDPIVHAVVVYRCK